MKRPYQSKSGTQYKAVMTTAEYQAGRNADEGWCLACAHTQGGCEPDARRYPCEVCGLNKVYGLEELLMMGLLIIEDREAA